MKRYFKITLAIKEGCVVVKVMEIENEKNLKFRFLDAIEITNWLNIAGHCKQLGQKIGPFLMGCSGDCEYSLINKDGIDTCDLEAFTRGIYTS